MSSMPHLDLVLQRVIPTPVAQVWRCWTEPALLMQWFCPKPWQTVECEIDLRPGGIFRTVMQSPTGDQHPNEGCYLELVPNERLVWTGALKAGFRPADAAAHPFVFTAVISLAPHADGCTLYTATVMHSDESGRQTHEAMGFHQGWGAALDQLVAVAAGL